MHYHYYELGWLFFIYSLAGWCIGTVVSAIRQKRLVNFGVLNLPLCPIYGFSAIAYSVFLSELKGKPVFLILGAIVISACLMVLTGLILTRIFHREWWGYERFRIGFHGFISAPLLLYFGAAALFVLWVGNPLILRLIRFIPKGLGKIALYVLFGFLLIDLLWALAVVLKWRSYINRMSGVTGNMHKVSASFGNVITRPVLRRLERSYPNIETEKILQAKAEEKPKKESRFAEGCGFYKQAWLFLIGSFFGDIVETVFCRFSLGSWMSRSSVVYGPFSIVWGIACSLLTAFLYRYRDRNDRFIFVYGTIVGGTYEYVCSVFTEYVFGTVFWNYSKIPFNLGGRINLLYCFFWGIVAVFWVKGAYPFLSHWIEKIPKKIGPALTWVLIVLMAGDILISAMALGRYSQRQHGIEAPNVVAEFIDEHFPDERMAKIYPKARIVR